MKAAMRLTILGCGGSMGVPVIGCSCEVCHSPHPKNKRLRPCALLEVGEKKILIDCGPDFRVQALSAGVTSLNGLILTHAHQDHIGGLDDLRILCLRSKEAIPALMSAATLRDIQTRYSYMFTPPPADGSPSTVVTRFSLCELESLRGERLFLDLPFRYFSYEQIGMQVTGFRLGTFAYVTDIAKYPTTIFEELSGIKNLVISALRFSPSPFHFSVDEAIDFAQKIGAEKVWLIHTAHELDYEKTNAYLPPHVRMAYDGMVIELGFLE